MQVERESIACHSSGKAGGFLASDWNDLSTKELSRKSYQLHKELSETLEQDVGYRELDTYSIEVLPSNSNKTAKRDTNTISWADGNITSTSTIGSCKTTAQVNPFLLTNALFHSAAKRGAKLVHGNVIDIETEAIDNVFSVKV